MRPEPKAEAERWLAQAEDELRDAELLAKARRFYLSLFLCQQSAEKALKAYLYLKVEEPIFSHSVDSLLDMAISYDDEFRSLLPSKRLDDYYIPTRYPNSLPGGIPSRYYDDAQEAERALALSQAVVHMARAKIKEVA